MAIHFNPAANNAVGNNDAVVNIHSVVHAGTGGGLPPLNLGQMQLNEADLRHLAHLPNLQPLDLGQVGPVNAAGLAALANLQVGPRDGA